MKIERVEETKDLPEEQEVMAEETVSLMAAKG
jgi:hypothetical protein